jgi:N utilization substance protein B
MLNKHKSRELAMQVLFLWDASGESDAATATQVISDGSEDANVQQLATQISQGAWEVREASDKWMEKLAPQWPPRRQPGVDRSILRLAIWELTAADTPPKVVIDEAIELAKTFSTELSPAFVNGVLDAILREKRELENPSPAKTEVDPPIASES